MSDRSVGPETRVRFSWVVRLRRGDDDLRSYRKPECMWWGLWKGTRETGFQYPKRDGPSSPHRVRVHIHTEKTVRTFPAEQ